MLRFSHLLQSAQGGLELEGQPIELKVNDRKPLHSDKEHHPAFIRFPAYYTISGYPATAPRCRPSKMTVVRGFMVLQLQHHDKASLLAGKLHAILQRFYTKGRDNQGLPWYLSNPA